MYWNFIFDPHQVNFYFSKLKYLFVFAIRSRIFSATKRWFQLNFFWQYNSVSISFLLSPPCFLTSLRRFTSVLDDNVEEIFPKTLKNIFCSRSFLSDTIFFGITDTSVSAVSHNKSWGVVMIANSTLTTLSVRRALHPIVQLTTSLITWRLILF